CPSWQPPACSKRRAKRPENYSLASPASTTPKRKAHRRHDLLPGSSGQQLRLRHHHRLRPERGPGPRGADALASRISTSGRAEYGRVQGVRRHLFHRANGRSSCPGGEAWAPEAGLWHDGSSYIFLRHTDYSSLTNNRSCFNLTVF